MSYTDDDYVLFALMSAAVVELLWTRWTFRFVVQYLDMSRCCGFAVQQAVQQIHNKSNKWSLSLTKVFFRFR